MTAEPVLYLPWLLSVQAVHERQVIIWRQGECQTSRRDEFIVAGKSRCG